MVSGIYCIERIETGQRYVGQGENVEKRMNEIHYNCILIYRAIKKYGNDDFIRFPIQYCEIEELDYWEEYYIKELHSHVSGGGYNITWGGNAPMRGRNHTDITREKMWVAQSGEKAYRFGVKDKDASSSYNGVYKTVRDNKRVYWQVQIKLNGETIRIGVYKNETDAAKAHDRYVVEHSLPNPLNFSEDYLQR